MMNVSRLSVFFPAFNEEENIKKTVLDTLRVLNNLKLKDFEIIIVNDGSSDRTGEVVKELTTQDKRVRLVTHPANKGYGGALKTGFKEAKFDWVTFTDSDGQFNFSEITKFIEASNQADVICGYRITRADSFLRKVFTFGWKTLAWALLGLTVKDYSCGFKMIRKKAYEAVLPLVGEEKVTQIEMLVKMKRQGCKFAEIGVHHYPRKFGKQTGANINVVVKSLVDLFKLWWKLLNNKLIFSLFILTLLLAVFFRFYRLSEYMTFLGDEGRDALMIKRILTTGDIPLLGPPTSIGNMYLGPLYYYMMTLPMALFWLDPVAGAGQVAFIGMLTVVLIYYLGKQWFGSLSGLISSFLYAISPVTITYSKSSWNPNPAPFFALLTIIGLYKAHQSSDYRWLVLSGVGLAFAAQMHYLALILIPIAVILWLYELLILLKKKLQAKYFFWRTLSAIIIFLILMSPLVVFDLKHNYMNYRAITTFFSSRETTVNLNPMNTLGRIVPIYNNNLIGRYITAEDKILTPVVSFLVLIPILLAFVTKVRGGLLSWPAFALAVWLLGGIFGLALYKQNIFDHYLGFLNPAPYLLLGGLVGSIKITSRNNRIFFAALTAILIAIIATLNLQKNPLKSPPNNQLSRTQNVARFIISQSENKPFNFALIAKNNYDSAYQFYLDIYGHRPKYLLEEITSQLFVVCEDPLCQPIGHPKYEIAAFGWAKIEKEQDFAGVKVYKLVANPSGKP